MSSEDLPDLPPPPYSAVDPTRSHPTLPSLATPDITTFNAFIPSPQFTNDSRPSGQAPGYSTNSPQHDVLTPRYVSPVAASVTTGFGSPTSIIGNDLERSGFVSASPYFELRSHDRPRPADTFYQHLIVAPETRPQNLPFPQAQDRWLWRGVDDQDWATFLNHLFPDHGLDTKRHEGLESEAGLGLQGLSLEKRRSRPDEAHPLPGNYSPGSLSSPTPQNHEDERLRRVRIGAVVAQWNEGFFEPRGLGVTLQFTGPMSPTSPGQMAARIRRSSVLQKAQPPAKLEDTPLHQAISKGSKSKVREALEQGDDLEALNKKGETPLFRAVSRDEKAIVQILLEKGANPATRPLGEKTPLQIAVSRDKKSIVKMLAEKCSLQEIEEVTPAGETALYLAVQKQLNSCIEILLEHGANLNSRPIAKESMLNVAVSASRSSIVKLLLERGAYVEERNKDGDTPLGRAVSRGETKIVKMLLEHGASVAARDGKGAAPLTIAVSRGDTSIVTQLLAQKGIDVEVQNLKGETALYKAISAGQTSIAHQLLQKGASADHIPPDADLMLNLVVSKGNTSLTHLLLERGVDVDVRNRAGETPLWKAISRSDVSIASLLVGKGADVNTTSTSGEPALYRAVSKGETSLVSILLCNGANPETKNPSGEAPLYRAVYRGDTSIVSLLLCNGANPEILSPSGETPLYRAVYRGDTSIVMLLLGRGADPEGMSGSGETALGYAVKKGNTSIVQILESYKKRKS